MNYFSRIHKKLAANQSDAVGRSGYEEFFTRQFTFFLNSDRYVTNQLISRMMDNKTSAADKVDCEEGVGDGRADVVIKLKSGEKIVLENKFDATLAEDQLSKYLQEPGTYVALCSERTESIPRKIKDHKRYLHPEEPEAPNYLWTDVYTLIKSAPSPPEEFQKMRLDFLEYMKSLALAPTDLPDEWPKLFNSSPDGTHKEIQSDFGNCLEKALSGYTQRGHSIGTSSRKNKVLKPLDVDQSVWRRIWIYPTELEMDEVDCSEFDVLKNLSEALAIQFVSFEDNHDEFRQLYDQVPKQFDDAPGDTWYRMKFLPHSGRGKRKFGLVRSLKPLIKERKELSAKLEEVIKPTLDFLLERINA